MLKILKKNVFDFSLLKIFGSEKKIFGYFHVKSMNERNVDDDIWKIISHIPSSSSYCSFLSNTEGTAPRH